MKQSKTMWLILIAIALVGCSKSEDEAPKVNTYNQYTGDLQYDSNGIALMECSKFFPKMGSLAGNIKVFKHNNIYYSDKVDVRLTSSIDLNNKILVFYRWKQESSGSVITDTNPLSFDVTVNGQIYTGFTQLTATSTGAVNTNQVKFAIHGTDIGYQAIQVAIYNATSGQIESYSDALIPFVYAHPKDYKNTHTSQNQLLNLHPYISQVSSNKSGADFARQSYSDFCF
ncbi:MAG: hypothetical protein KDD37_10265 [Bdellovibrionales bacterium]|nr:hypothetical protein [Bdellovibrionales bacterium]